MDWFLAASWFINDYLWLWGAALGLGCLVASRKKEALLVAVLALLLLLPAVKVFYGDARPCLGEPWCLSDMGFPSAHAAAAFVFVAASIGLPASFLFLPAALVVAYSRIYLGVHTVDQVVGGAAFAFVVFFLCDWLVAHVKKRYGIKSRWGGVPRGALG
jgi:membrane-associated phospholipid phosphatase